LTITKNLTKLSYYADMMILCSFLTAKSRILGFLVFCLYMLLCTDYCRALYTVCYWHPSLRLIWWLIRRVKTDWS